MTTDTRKPLNASPIPPVLNAKMVRRNGSIVEIKTCNQYTGIFEDINLNAYFPTGYWARQDISQFDLMSIYVEPKPAFEVFLDELWRFINGDAPNSDLLVIYNKARVAYDAERKK